MFASEKKTIIKTDQLKKLVSNDEKLIILFKFSVTFFVVTNSEKVYFCC